MKNSNRFLMILGVMAVCGVTSAYSADHTQTEREITSSNPERAPRAPGSDTDVDVFVNRQPIITDTTADNSSLIFTPYKESIQTTDSSATLNPEESKDVDLGASSSGRGR